eukprot:m.103402 g.103402  ORF g.103402 m.103402 type:complete len:184 (-) comp27495_c3_seq1:206-757(-)
MLTTTPSTITASTTTTTLTTPPPPPTTTPATPPTTTTTPAPHTKTSPLTGSNSEKPCRSLSKLIEYPGDIEKLKILLADDTIDAAGKDMFGFTALMKIASWDKVDQLDVLLSVLNETDVNTVDAAHTYTALHHAIDMNALRCAQRLITHTHVDITLKDNQGCTPFDLAKLRGAPLDFETSSRS